VTNPVRQRPHIADADYYRLGYQLAAQLMNGAAAHADRGRRRPGAPAIVNDDPLAVARRLLEDADIVLRWYRARSRSALRRRRPAPHEDRLRTFLAETIVPCCELIAARRLHQLERADEAQPLVDDVLRRAAAGELSYRAYYALACLEANDGEHADAIEYLGRALYEAPAARRAELAEWARNDPAFAPVRAAVIALVEPRDAPAPAPAPAPTTFGTADVLAADIAALEQAVDDLSDRPVGATAARIQLASAYQLAERTEEAVALDGRAAEDLAALLEPGHPAVALAQQVLERSQRLLRRAEDRAALASEVLVLRDELLQALAELI
jgi:hypothetical protein